MFTEMVILNLLMKRLLGSNLLQCFICCRRFQMHILLTVSSVMCALQLWVSSTGISRFMHRWLSSWVSVLNLQLCQIILTGNKNSGLKFLNTLPWSLQWNPDISILDIALFPVWKWIFYVPAKFTVKCMGQNPNITIFDITIFLIYDNEILADWVENLSRHNGIITI